MKKKIFVLSCAVLALISFMVPTALAQVQVEDYDVDSILRSVSTGTGSMTLTRALEDAFRTNPTVLASKADYASARAAYRKSFGSFLPSLDFTAAATLRHARNDATIVRSSGGSNDYFMDSQKLALSQLIWDGGATAGRVDADELHAGSKLRQAYNIAEEVALHASQYYLEVIRNRGILELSRRNVENHEHVLGMVTIRQHSGAGTMADVYQAEAALAEARSKQIQAEQNVHDAEANYGNVFGMLPGVLRLPESGAITLPMTVEAGITMALERNNALKAADLGVQQREKELESAEGSLLPRISLDGSLGRSDNTSGFDQTYSDASIGLFLKFNIFNGGASRAAISEARSLLHQAQFKREETRRSIEQDVRTAYNFMRATGDLLPVLGGNVTQNRKTLASYLDQFRMGTRTLLDLLDAETSLFTAEQALLNGKVANIYSFYRTCLPLSSLLSTLKLDAAVKIEQD